MLPCSSGHCISNSNSVYANSASYRSVGKAPHATVVADAVAGVPFDGSVLNGKIIFRHARLLPGECVPSRLVRLRAPACSHFIGESHAGKV